MSYQICTKTVMDNIADPNIQFDENGISNYWHDYQNVYAKLITTGEEGKKLLNAKVDEIKKAGKDKEYDCIIGLSGGVDSTYIAYLVKQLGLRPLAIHFDNGWNSEIAVKNIQNCVRYLNCDLYTLVVDWEEFSDLQLSYLKASVIDIEVLTDHAIIGALYQQANKYNVKYIMSGTNYSTEAVLPSAWIYNKLDATNIKAIHKKFGKVKLKTYPFITNSTKRSIANRGKFEIVMPLNLMDYRKKEVKEVITKELNWQDYGGKHYESKFTKFYQAYILPTKFKVDKRKAHLSNLICSNQLTREEALEELKLPLYDENIIQKDIDYVVKKFKISRQEFDDIMNSKVHAHTDYAIEQSLVQKYPILTPVKKIYKKFT